jgi:hypothetical protein
LDKGDLPLLRGHSLSERVTLPLPIRVFFLRPDVKETHFYLFFLASGENIDPIEKLLRWIEAFDPI